MNTKWTDSHYTTLRQMIGASTDTESTDAKWLMSEATRLGLPIGGKHTSLAFAISNACRNTPTWPRAEVSILHLSRARDAEKRRAKASPSAIAPTSPPTRATASKGHPLVDVPPPGYSLAADWGPRLGLAYVAGSDIPNYVPRVYVRASIGQSRLFVEDAAMRRFQAERATPAKARRIEIGRMGQAAKKAKAAGIVAPVQVVAPPAVEPVIAAPRLLNGHADGVRDAISDMLARGTITAAQAVAMIAETVK